MRIFVIRNFVRAGALGALGFVLICVAAGNLRAAEVKAGDIAILKAWSRASSTANGVVYLTLRNDGGTADRLVGVSTDAARMSMLHVTKKENGVETMRDVDGIDIPAHATVTLKPGGLHIMLMGLGQPLKAGATFPISLTFAKAGAATVQVAVKPAGASGAAQGSMDKMDMGTMKGGSGN